MQLKNEGFLFRLSVLGEQFSEIPEIFGEGTNRSHVHTVTYCDLVNMRPRISEWGLARSFVGQF